MFNNLNEIQNCIINEYKNKRISFKINQNNVKMIISNVILNNNFELNIPLIESRLKINELIPMIKEMKQKIDFLENENKELKNQISETREKNKTLEERVGSLENNKELKNQINGINEIREKNKVLEERINNLEKTILEFQQDEKKQKTINKYFQDSNIIKNEKDSDLLISFLPNKPNKTSLLFNSLRDGDTLQSLHNKIDNISPTYMIIKTNSDRIFGGYTTHLWNIQNDKQSIDNKAFVFSLDNKKKYSIKNPEYAIVERKQYIQFGACCFRIKDKFKISDNDESDCHFETNSLCLAGKNIFKVKNLEVYLIE